MSEQFEKVLDACNMNIQSISQLNAIMESFITKLSRHQDGATHQIGVTSLMDFTQTTVIGVVLVFVQPNLINVVVKGNGQPNFGGTLGANNQVGLE
jgi:hypothetical protein